MRIAYVVPRLHKHGGTEVGIAMLVEDLRSEHRISVVSHSVEEIALQGIDFHRIPMISRPAVARYLTFLGANTAMVPPTWLRNGFDIVHSTGADTIYANVVTAQFCQAERLRLVRQGIIRLPAVTREQRARRMEGLAFGTITSLMERLIYRSPRVSAIIAVSAGVKGDLLRHYGVSPDRVVVIPNAVDHDRFTPASRERYRAATRSACGAAEDQTVLLFVAHEWERKGLPLVLQALSLLNERDRRAARLVVVGRGNRPHYAGMADRLGVGESVCLAGEASDSRPYYAAADLLVFPSHYEAFSLVTLEAAACGLPLVVTRINGTEELVEEGRNGFFVMPDPADIARRLATLIENPDLRVAMGQAARDSAMRYSRTEVAARTLALYERVASS